MSITVEPLKTSELDDYIRILWDAFEILEANMIMPMIFPEGLQPDLLERLRYSTIQSTGGNLESYCYCAKDSASREIIGIARWTVVEHPPQTKEEMEAKYEKEVEARQSYPPVAGMNKELDHAWFRAMLYCEMETTGCHPYMILQLLAIHPKHQRRGTGTVLLKQCLEEADSLGLPVYLDCGVFGKPLYERFGFRVIRELPLNCLDYGGRSSGIHWLVEGLA